MGLAQGSSTQPATTRPAWSGPHLLVTPELVASAKAKAASQEWAGLVLARVLTDADGWSGKPIGPPTTGGGWYHNYVCPVDASMLTYDERQPHEHLCPKCGKHYRGEKLDESWVNTTHMNYAAAAEGCALSWQITGRQQYAEWAAGVLLWYARHYEQYPAHGQWAGRGRVTGQSLDEAMWLIPMASAFDMVCSTMRPEEAAEVIDKLFLPAARHIAQFGDGVHNIQCWQASARLAAGLLADDLAMVEAAAATLRKSIEQGIREDGFWFEASVAYHHFTLMALAPAMLMARHNRLDLGPSQKLREMYAVAGKIVMPDGGLPALNDGWHGYSMASMAYHLEIASYLFNDPAFSAQLAGARRTPRPDLPGHLVTQRASLLYGPAVLPASRPASGGSYRMTGAGLAVLRHEGYTAIVKAGTNSGGHDHPDRGQLILGDDLRTWFDDLGTPGYGHPMYGAWYRHTASHCTILVDGQPQKTNVVGKIPQFVDRPNYKLATVTAEGVYPGVTLTRSLAIMDGRVFEVFSAASDAEHEYTFVLHAPGELSLDLPQPTPATQPAAHVKLGPATLPVLAARAPLVTGAWSIAASASRPSEAPAAALHAPPPVLEAGRLAFAIAALGNMRVASGPVPGFPAGEPRAALALSVRGREATFAATYASDRLAGAEVRRIEFMGPHSAVFLSPDGTTYRLTVNAGLASLSKSGSPRARPQGSRSR